MCKPAFFRYRPALTQTVTFYFFSLLFSSFMACRSFPPTSLLQRHYLTSTNAAAFYRPLRYHFAGSFLHELVYEILYQNKISFFENVFNFKFPILSLNSRDLYDRIKKYFMDIFNIISFFENVFNFFADIFLKGT